MKPGYQGTFAPPGTASATGAATQRATAADDDEHFLAALEAATLPPQEFNHAAHVRAGYLYLRKQAFPQSTAAMCATIARYARAIGKPGRYHETITVAFMALINAQLRRHGDRGGWEQFRAANPQLFRPDILLAYYPRAMLESPEARTTFTLVPLGG